MYVLLSILNDSEIKFLQVCLDALKVEDSTMYFFLLSVSQPGLI
jgi:hypothetical protein